LSVQAIANLNALPADIAIAEHQPLVSREALIKAFGEMVERELGD